MTKPSGAGSPAATPRRKGKAAKPPLCARMMAGAAVVERAAPATNWRRLIMRGPTRRCVRARPAPPFAPVSPKAQWSQQGQRLWPLHLSVAGHHLRDDPVVARFDDPVGPARVDGLPCRSGSFAEEQPRLGVGIGLGPDGSRLQREIVDRRAALVADAASHSAPAVVTDGILLILRKGCARHQKEQSRDGG